MRKQWTLVLAVVVAFGILVPWYKGLDFFDPVLIVAYSCLALLFVAPASAEAFAPARDVPTSGESLKRVALVLGYGWGLSVLILSLGIATVNVSHWHGSILTPPATFLTASFLFGLTASFFVSEFCSILARRLSAASVKGIIRLVFLVLLATVAFGNRFLPEQTQAAIAAQMTTQGITHLALVASAVLAFAGVIFAAAAALVPMSRGPESP